MVLEQSNSDSSNQNPYQIHDSPRSSTSTSSSSLWSHFRHFIRASIALVGQIVSWLALWYIVETEIFPTTLERNLILILIGIIIMFFTRSLGGQAGLGKIYFEPPQRRGIFGIFDSILYSLCDRKIETLEIKEILRRKSEKPWETNVRMLYKYLSTAVAFTGGVVYWVGMYVAIDQYLWPSNPIEKHYIFASVGFFGMVFCGSISIESGIWDENSVTAHSIGQVLFYFFRSLLSLQFQVLYWIGVDHIFEQDLFPPTAIRHAAYLTGGFLLVSLVNTAGGMTGADDIKDDNEVAEADKQFEQEIEETQRVRAETIAIASRSPTNFPRSDSNILSRSDENYFTPPLTAIAVHRTTGEDNEAAKVLFEEGSKPFSISPHRSSKISVGRSALHPAIPPLILINHIPRSDSEINEAESESKSLPTQEFERELSSVSDSDRVTWKHFFYNYTRLFLSLAGGILLWEGFESSLLTHTVYSYANDVTATGGNNSTSAGEGTQIDDGTAPNHNTLWKLLAMLFVGWVGLLLTGTFYSNSGVSGPVNMSRGRSSAYRELHRLNVARILSSFRLTENDDKLADERENELKAKRGSLTAESRVLSTQASANQRNNNDDSDRISLSGIQFLKNESLQGKSVSINQSNQ